MNLKKHMVNSTALLAVLTPVWASVETYGYKLLREGVYSNESLQNMFNSLNWDPEGLAMTESASQISRIIGAATFYGGVGLVINKGRELSQKVNKITKESSEKIKKLHDTVYMGLISGAITPAYMWATEAISRQDIDTPTIVMASAISAAIGFCGGSLMGYAADTYEDLCGVKESERLPERIRNLSKEKKLGLAGLLTATAAGATLGIYQLYNEVPAELVSETIENIVR